MATELISSSILTYKYRLLPTRKQHVVLSTILESQRQLYNGALEHRIAAYRVAKKNISLYDQMEELTQLRKEIEYSYLPGRLQRWTLRRLDDAYQAFFKRAINKERRAGFPRFRGISRWRSFGFSEFCGISIVGSRLRFKGMCGGLRMHLHRKLPVVQPLCCTFTRDEKGWYVSLQYRLANVQVHPTGQNVGVDVGLTHLVTLSNGEHIPNPRVALHAEKERRRKQRALSRCKKGSTRRRKVQADLARAYSRVRNTRSTNLHSISSRLVREYDMIALEKLNVRGLASGMLAKSVHDASWSRLKEMLKYKAAKAGRQLIEVQAAGTSQTCPSCGAIKAKALAERVHNCDCGCVMDRDHAAAVVILQRAVVGPWTLNAGH